MKMFLFCLLLFSATSLAQPVAIKIEKITSSDSTYRRTFTVLFSVENISDKTISFFLNPEHFTPAHAGPLENSVFYKIYEEKEEYTVSTILSTHLKVGPDGIPIKYRDYRTLSMEDLENLRVQRQEDLFNTMMTLLPGEKRVYTKELLWNYERYHKQSDHEYYIAANQPHYLELMLIFWREEYKTKLTAEQFDAVLLNESIIKGWFVSNKMVIDFSEKKSN